MNDLVVSVRLTADGDGFTGALRLSGRELEDFRRRAGEADGGARRLGGGMDYARRQAMLLNAAIVTLVTVGMKRLATGFTDAANEAEGYRFRLNFLLRDQEEANRLFQDAAKLAEWLPFEYRNVMGAATTLAGVLRGGREEVMRYLPMISDLAAVAGLSIEQTTEQVVRMISSGAAAARTFRENGILEFLGFQAGVEYSARETREQLFREWEKTDSRFRGAARALSETWEGLIGGFTDRWYQFRTNVMERGSFDFLKSGLYEALERLEASGDQIDGLAQKISDGIENVITSMLVGGADIADAVTPIFDRLVEGVNNLIRAYNSLDPGVREIGLLGFLLLGFRGKALVLGVASFANEIRNAAEWYVKAFEETRAYLRRQLGLDPHGGIDLSPGRRLGGVTIDLTTGEDISDRALPLIPAPGRSDGPGPAGRWARDFRDAARLRRTNEIDREDQELGAILRDWAARGAGGRPQHDQPQAAMDFIHKGMMDVIPVYDRAVQAANRWKQEALKGLDETAAGYDDHVADIEYIFNVRIKEAYEAGLRASQNWERGVERAFLDYRRAAADMARAAEDLLAGSFRRAEDAVIEFVKTGKLELGSLFDFILTELLRIQIRKQMAGIFGGIDLAGLVGDLFRGAGAGGGFSPSSAPAPDVSTVAVAHGGGVIGRDVFATRAASTALWDGAPRFHSGGVVGGEERIIAQRGETIFTPGQLAALPALVPPINIQIVNQGGGEASVSEREGPRGGRDIMIVLEERLAGRVRGGGPLGRAIEQTYGLGRGLAAR